MWFGVLVLVASVARGQGPPQKHECVYTVDHGGKEPYVLNLTEISDWTVEREEPDHFYYYTPCGNRLRCSQGGALFSANTVQMKQGDNVCTHFLSVDHHDRPEYSFVGDSWRFHFEDGEMCDVTQQPRRTTIYYHCNDVNNGYPAQVESAEEVAPCDYVYTLRSKLACVPPNSFNANCQWKVPDRDGDGEWKMLDLSALQQKVVRAELGNGYDYYYSVCANDLHCFQQKEQNVMAALYNHETRTCEHTLAVWEHGNANPLIAHNSNPPHWSFHYWNGDICSNGRQGEFRVRWFCDEQQDEYKVIDHGLQGDCDFYLNISSKHACMDAEPTWVAANVAFGEGFGK